MKRYHITLGARTTAGGSVTGASSLASIDGAPMALEGDKVSCPQCHGDGVIVCAGPRLPDEWEGRRYALQDDLCACKCVPAPRLVAIQTLKCQHVESP
jgi:type VI secretion system secreted protein VgrG